MQPHPSFVDWLASLSQQDLAGLIDQRPDAIVPPTPRDLTELADRLSRDDSLVAAVVSLGQPALDMLRALLVLGSSATLDSVADLLAAPTPRQPTGAQPSHSRATREQLAQPLTQLQAAALVWPVEARLLTQPGLRNVVDSPYDFGPPLEQLVAEMTVPRLHQLQATLGLPRGGNKDSVTAALVDHLSRPEVVTELVAQAPSRVADELRAMAELGTDFDPVGISQRSWANRQETIKWGSEHGLLYGIDTWGYGSEAQMPAQVALALLGDDFVLPFHPDPPPLVLVDIAPERVRAQAAAAVTEFDQHVAGLLDQLSRHPAAALKSGGLGARELTRLAKTVGADSTVVRLALELAAAAGLLDVNNRSIGVSAGYRDWRSADPGQRLASLLAVWVFLPLTATATRGDDGRTRSALDGSGDGLSARLRRHALLAQLSRLDDGRATSEQSLRDRIAWARPFAAAKDDSGVAPLGWAWNEAQLLGVLAMGSLSPLGRTLVSGDAGRLAAVAAELLPNTADSARFGTDLTAMVIGSPGPDVTGLLDAAADREKAGSGATMWRFSQDSVRRAMAEGATAEDLLTRLAALARDELPQPLRYLIGDVARRHGQLRIRTATSVIHCADEGLLAEVAADRRLRELGVRLLAPTVVGCDVPVEEALAALRAAGYFPMPDDDQQPDAPPDGGARPAPSSIRATEPADPGAEDTEPADELPDNVYDLFADMDDTSPATEQAGGEVPKRAGSADVAERLVGRVSAPALLTETEKRLAGLTRRLSPAQRRQLAFALDHDWPAQLAYKTKGGHTEDRLFNHMRLLGTAIVGYSMDSREQWARVDRIFDVSTVDPDEPGV